MSYAKFIWRHIKYYRYHILVTQKRSPKKATAEISQTNILVLYRVSSIYHSLCNKYIYVYISILENKQNEQNNENRARAIKQLLKVLFLAIKMSTGFITDVI